jgi:hypothetical protein
MLIYTLIGSGEVSGDKGQLATASHDEHVMAWYFVSETNKVMTTSSCHVYLILL